MGHGQLCIGKDVREEQEDASKIKVTNCKTVT